MLHRFSGPLVLIGILSAVAPGVAAQQNLADVQLETIPVAGGIYMLRGPGGNIGLSVGDDGAFLIDDKFAPLTEKIKAAVAAVSSGDVRFVVNTHWHGDHVGGNENFGEAGALIVAHENVRRRMSVEQVQEIFGRRVPPSPAGALPVITFTDAVTFHWNGDDIRAFHIAHAHTDGDAIIHFPNSNVIHMGDTFFNGLYPFIDVGSGGSINGVIEAAEEALRVADSDTRIIPGHGPLASETDLRKYRDMLITVRDRVRVLVNDGKSMEEVIAAKPSAEWDDELGGFFINPAQFVTFVYRGVGGR